MTPARFLPAVVVLFAALPAMAQVATSTAGDVGSASLRGAYPGAGGAVALPFPLSATRTTSGAMTAGAAAASGATPFGASSGTSTARGAGGGRGGNAAASGASTGTTARSSRGRGGGANWVLCPPSGASDLAPLFTGTDLSCAPD